MQSDYIEIISSLLTLIGILIGVRQFNKGQDSLQKKEIEQRQFELKKMVVGSQFEAIAKFKEIQAIKYKETSEVISSIIYSDSYNSEDFKNNLKRFWQLYWVELSSVEDDIVESAMVPLGEFIEYLTKKNIENISENDKKILFNLGYAVAQAIKVSSKTWGLPDGYEM